MIFSIKDFRELGIQSSQGTLINIIEVVSRLDNVWLSALITLIKGTYVRRVLGDGQKKIKSRH